MRLSCIGNWLGCAECLSPRLLLSKHSEMLLEWMIHGKRGPWPLYGSLPLYNSWSSYHSWSLYNSRPLWCCWSSCDSWSMYDSCPWYGYWSLCTLRKRRYIRVTARMLKWLTRYVGSRTLPQNSLLCVSLQAWQKRQHLSVTEILDISLDIRGHCRMSL